MSFWVAVDVFIGLMLCYLLLGLIGSSTQEALASWLNLRGECLRQGMKTLLAHAPDGARGADWLFARIAGHSLIRPSPDGRSPSYVSAVNFSTALVDSLLDGSQRPLFSQVEATVAALPAGPVRQSLTALVMRAEGDLGRFEASVQQWFDDAMDRVSGVYKRLAHNYLLVFGLVVALFGNIDSLEIAAALQRDPAVLAQVVAAAQGIVHDQPPATAASAPPLNQAAQAAGRLSDLGLPMGWTAAKFAAIARPYALVLKLLGLLITTLAVSLGAPFWFDTLQLFLNLRTAGPKPARADAGN